MPLKRILVGSPVRQKHQILQEFLAGLDEADQIGLELSYYFVDDNDDALSSELLSGFAASHDAVIKKARELTQPLRSDDPYANEVTHAWNSAIIQKIAFFKDSIIEYAIAQDFDYLFLVDSDIVIDRRTLQQLLSRKLEIVSNVFWTQWQPNWELEPQCFWIPDLTSQSLKPFSGPMGLAAARQTRRNYFAKLRIPGLYQVDGLGACTMITVGALKKGVRFRQIPNLSMQGEDRHFCIRAGALGIDLFLDTVYPVYHIYREAYLDRVAEFKRDGFRYDMCQTFVPQNEGGRQGSEFARIVRKAFAYLKNKALSKIRKQKNPPLRYSELDNESIALCLAAEDEDLPGLPAVLDSVSACVDSYAVFVRSEEAEIVCRNMLAGKPCRIIRRAACENPYQLLWESLGGFHPGWVLSLDKNKALAPDTAAALRCLTSNRAIHLYRFVSGKNDRAAETERGQADCQAPCLMRFQPAYRFQWTDGPTGGRLPDEAGRVAYAEIDLTTAVLR